MKNNQPNGAQFVNSGFQGDEGRPPPYVPQMGLYPSISPPPSYTFEPINTQQTAMPGIPHNTRQNKGVSRYPRKYVVCISLCMILVLLVVTAVLLWYFLYYQCLLGKLCKTDGACLSLSQWCDGVKDCPSGEDEAQCFRMHGTNYLLQSYVPDSGTWMPVCADNWNNNYGRAMCEQIGYKRQEYVSSTQTSAGSMASNGYMKLKPGSSPSGYIGPQLIQCKNCAHAVSLKCIECGQSPAAPSTRIVGGTDAAPGAWPWQVSLQINNQHLCGGSIITLYWIVSAAHCFKKYNNPEIWRVQAGKLRLSEMEHFSGNRVDKIIIHENFDRNTLNNDIALLKLAKALTFTEKIKPVCLPNVGVDLSAGKQAWITGWGTIYSSGTKPNTLNQAQVTIYSREECNKPWVLNGAVTETMICAGKMKGGVDSCQGDSGGPLVVKDGVWWLAGDTSWGVGCGQRDKPGVYGNVTYFTEWIYREMNTFYR
ncbi:transmembrane protease serine 2 [Thalassophryne amazonica]|uniref:transmembrane protease serine 2 n=1 Tax=Thalassophryne amazonica TaxID=390379 RepID=UPI00147090B2|nr:transmembrane protease serine 2 [Thalassophryne amazonica]